MRLLAFFILVIFSSSLSAEHEKIKLKVVASFSVIGDMISNIAGDKIDLSVIVGANQDAHVFEPRPKDLKMLSDADLLILNGFGFESWLEKLVAASGFKGKKIIASNGITPIFYDGNTTGQKLPDPHAWHSLPNGQHYVENIMVGLKDIDAQNADFYETQGKSYIQKIKELDNEMKEAFKQIPGEKRVVITSHDAFEYLGKEYGIKFISPLGVSTEAEVLPKQIESILTRIKKENIKAIFAEATTDKRLIEQIACQSGITLGGQLFSDALSDPKESGGTYLGMVKSNLEALKNAFVTQLKTEAEALTKGCKIH